MFSVGALDIDETNATAQQAMRQAARHILYTISQTEFSEATLSEAWFYYLVLPLNIILCVAVAAYIIVIVTKTIQKKKKVSGSVKKQD